MRHVLIPKIRVRNFRSIADSGELDLGTVTVLIGANNSGKSALLRAMLMAHGSGGWDFADVRHGTRGAEVQMTLEKPYPEALARGSGTDLSEVDNLTLHVEGFGGVSTKLTWDTSSGPQGGSTHIHVSYSRPDHLFVPVLTRRRAAVFETTVAPESAATVGLDDRSLSSRLTALGDHPEGDRYRSLMQRILGLSVSTLLVQGGVTPGIPLSTDTGIELARMGDGVRNVVLLATELADQSRPRVFLIEEPENDLHPQALLALMEVLREASHHHQLIVTTHSDVVLRELGSLAGSRVYETSSTVEARVPTTTYRPLVDEFDRREALATLGYTHDLPIGWLVLEESTAETFIRSCLIPLFVPKLGMLRTAEAKGTTNVTRTVTGLHRMVLFARLLQDDAPRAWVLVDGDKAGHDAVRELKRAFSTWPESRFVTLPEPNLESFYPPRFHDQLKAIDTAPRRDRSRLKGELVEHMVAWAYSDPEALGELERSAAGLIAELRRIEREILLLQSLNDR